MTEDDGFVTVHPTVEGRCPTGRATAAAQPNPQAVSGIAGIPNALEKNMEKHELLCRAWIACDPNRGGCDPDELLGPRADSLGNVWETELTGEPYWKWFGPRATALEEYLANHGWKIVRAE